MEFYTQKDFGQLISAPFIFFGKEFKPLITSILIFVGPFIVIESILIGYFNFSPAKDVVTQIQNIGANTSGTAYFIQFFEFFKNIMLYTFIAVYAKIYVQKGTGNIETADVWKGISRFYWPVAGGQLLGGIIIVIGFLLIVIPGIYLAVALAPLFVIIVFEENGISKSLTKSFELIKGSWWLVLGLFIVMFIMLTTASGILYLLSESVFGIVAPGSVNSAIYNVFDLSFELLISTFLILLPIFIYGHLIAEKEQPELVNKIAEISDNNEDPTEKETKTIDDPENLDENRFLDDTDTDRFKPKI